MQLYRRDHIKIDYGRLGLICLVMTVMVIMPHRIVYLEVPTPVTGQYRENFQRFPDRNFI
jgi:hypothetical protein